MKKKIWSMLFVLGMLCCIWRQDAVAAEPVELTEEMFVVNTTTETYSGEAIEKTVTSDNLVEDVDYTVEYIDNINAGTATIRISGIGDYTGEITKEFTIEKAERFFLANATSTKLYTASNSQVINITYDNAEAEETAYTFTSSNRDVAYVSGYDNRIIAGKVEGSAVITVEAAETANYTGGSVDIELTVRNIEITVADAVGGRVVVSTTEAYYGQIVTLEFISEENYRPYHTDVRDENNEIVGLHYGEENTMYFYAPESDISITPTFQHISEWEKVKIELTYLYINEDGDNSLCMDTQYVYSGTTWGEFFETYEKWYENGIITDAAEDVTWDEVDIQRRITTDLDEWKDISISDFNSYSGCALFTFYGYPADTYEHGYYSFEYLVDGKYKDSGTGWDLLLPKALEYGSEQAIEYAERNIKIHSYIYDLCKMPGATYIVENVLPPEEQGEGWKGYNVRIEASPVTEVFEDVPTGKWYTDAVQYVCENGLMVGKSENRFDTAGKIKRKEFATILYKMAGKPAISGETDFTDVKSTDWFGQAVCWLAENGIADGYGNGEFGVNNLITRQQLALMLYKYSGSPEVSVKVLEGFADADKISSYAVNAVAWAVENGIISGSGSGRELYINPKGDAKRSEAAVMIKAYMTN